jgi:hypothetical protein
MCLSSIDEGDALLGPELQRSQARHGKHFGCRASAIALPQLALANQGQRKVCERREVAAGAYASLLRDGRMQSGIEHAHQELSQLRACAGESLGKDVRA